MRNTIVRMLFGLLVIILALESTGLNASGWQNWVLGGVLGCYLWVVIVGSDQRAETFTQKYASRNTDFRWRRVTWSWLVELTLVLIWPIGNVVAKLHSLDDRKLQARLAIQIELAVGAGAYLIYTNGSALWLIPLLVWFAGVVVLSLYLGCHQHHSLRANFRGPASWPVKLTREFVALTASAAFWPMFVREQDRLSR